MFFALFRATNKSSVIMIYSVIMILSLAPNIGTLPERRSKFITPVPVGSVLALNTIVTPGGMKNVFKRSFAQGQPETFEAMNDFQYRGEHSKKYWPSLDLPYEEDNNKLFKKNSSRTSSILQEAEAILMKHNLKNHLLGGFVQRLRALANFLSNSTQDSKPSAEGNVTGQVRPTVIPKDDSVSPFKPGEKEKETSFKHEARVPKPFERIPKGLWKEIEHKATEDPVAELRNAHLFPEPSQYSSTIASNAELAGQEQEIKEKEVKLIENIRKEMQELENIVESPGADVPNLKALNHAINSPVLEPEAKRRINQENQGKAGLVTFRKLWVPKLHGDPRSFPHPIFGMTYKQNPFAHEYMNRTNKKNLQPSKEVMLSPNHRIEAGLTEEMKRELRNGKVILMSDSLVRSNFQDETTTNIAG